MGSKVQTWQVGGFAARVGVFGLTEKELLVLEALRYLEGFNQYYIVKKLREHFGIPPSTTKFVLSSLVKKGLVRREGRLYYLVEVGVVKAVRKPSRTS